MDTEKKYADVSEINQSHSFSAFFSGFVFHFMKMYFSNRHPGSWDRERRDTYFSECDEFISHWYSQSVSVSGQLRRMSKSKFPFSLRKRKVLWKFKQNFKKIKANREKWHVHAFRVDTRASVVERSRPFKPIGFLPVRLSCTILRGQKDTLISDS